MASEAERIARELTPEDADALLFFVDNERREKAMQRRQYLEWGGLLRVYANGFMEDVTDLGREVAAALRQSESGDPR